MTDAAVSVELLERGLRQCDTLIADVTPEQLELPTPCSLWSVRDLVTHMVNGLESFRGVLAGKGMQSHKVPLGADFAAAYHRGAEALLADWHAEGALTRTLPLFGGQPMPATVPLGLQITETALHAWDLATAIGRNEGLDPDIAEAGLAFSRQMMKPDMRGDAFGPEKEAAPDAGIYERLAAFSGREIPQMAR